MLVFDLVRVIVRNFSIGQCCHLHRKAPALGLNLLRLDVIIMVFVIADLFVEDLFEVTSCYFPIDFTPVSVL